MRCADGPVANIPAEFNTPTCVVAGYVNRSGIGVTYPQVVARFPQATHLSITTNGSAADMADVEPGAMPSWVGYPVGYCAVSAANSLIARYGRPPKLFTAHYTGTPHLCSPACWPGLVTTADGTQWTTHNNMWDESLLAVDFFSFRGSAPPIPRPPSVNPYPIEPYQPTVIGALMAPFMAKIPVGANGEGWAVFDGGINSDPGTASLTPAIPWNKMISCVAYSDDPTHDRPDWPTPVVGVQQRGGWLFIKASGAQPGNTVVAAIVYS